MAFDPITFAAVNTLTVVGSVLQVAESFSDPRYLEGDTQFDPAEYPKLAESTPPGFNGNVFNEITVPRVMPQALLATPNQFGLFSPLFTIGADLYYIQTLTLDIYKTTDGDLSTFSFWKTLQTPLLPGEQSSITSIRELNGFLYCATTRGNLRIDLSDPSLETQALMTGLPPTGSFRYAYGNGVYVVINSSVAGQTVYSSTDGLTFVSRTATYTATFIPAEIDFGNGLFVIVTNGATTSNASSSPDGITWTVRNVGTIAQRSVRYSSAAAIWVSAASANGGAFWSSPDGITWTSRAQGTPVSTGQLLTFSVVNGVFIATFLHNAAVACIQVSTNGTTWVNRASSGNFAGPNGLLCGSNRFIGLGSQIVGFGAMGGNGQTQMSIAVSDDNLVTSTVVKLIQGKSDIGGRFPIFLAGGQVGLIIETGSGTTPTQSTQLNALRTTDGGATWTPVTIPGYGAPAQFFVSTLSATPTKFVMLAQPATTSTVGTVVTGIRIGRSDDGLTWTWSASLSAAFTRMIAKNETLILWSAGSAALNISSNYGDTWGSRTITATAQHVMANGNNLLAINHVSASYASANDGLTWTTITGILVAASTFGFATGSQDGSIAMWAPLNDTRSFFSFDGGFTWEPKTLPSTNFQSAAVSDGWLILNTGNGFTYRTRDGNTWASSPLNGQTANLAPTVWRDAVITADGNLVVSGTILSQAAKYLMSTRVAHVTPGFSSPSVGTKLVIRAK